ncbi:DUF2637 domain-containing protein [Kitasatospora sp. NPDC092948]|uniref:DUF2637 domain-containing protein n=1 Tax=Kitasatospora sp. NPDC092948 TaxID=3364088 RepID=UPI0038155CA6
MNAKAKFWMVAALLAVVGMAFRVSWNALKDVATSVGADEVAAGLYPLVVDGLMALALVAALILTGSDRRFALRVLGGYTVASLVLNYVHGLVPALHGGGRVRLADWPPAHYALVLLASCLPVGSIFFGSDLVAKVLHQKPKTAENTSTVTNRSGSDLPGSADPVAVESVEESADPVPPVDPIPAPEPVREQAAAIVPSRSRRSAGPVPRSARGRVPIRTEEELLTEARSATADWPESELTADRIRTALRTSPARARVLRESLKAERAGVEGGVRLAEGLHLLPAPTDDDTDTGEGEERVGLAS